MRARAYPGIDDSVDYDNFHTVTASSEVEAEHKIRDFYDEKSDNYGVYYSVQRIEFFEHIS